jgi:hypothetical protein
MRILEAAAGAVAVALAAAEACRAHGLGQMPEPHAFLDAILSRVRASAVRTGIEHARDVHPQTPIFDVVDTLGNGDRVTAQDTVPYTP